jgi:aminoglycoside phosphotransferase (APT) family kinase protein
MPAAEVDVTLELVHQLLNEQHPDLSDRPLAVLANGWDNVMVRCGTDLVIRLPRRQVAAELVLSEQRWLPMLAERLPLPIPVPLRIGRPSAGYPWPWSVVPFLPGRPAAIDPPVDPAETLDVLAAFLAALHLPAAPSAPLNRYRGVPLADRTAVDTTNLAAIADPVVVRAATAIRETALAAGRWAGDPVWVHGDLHPANMLVDAGRLSGVIDFGDLTAGDPATDLSVIWMVLPVSQHQRFWTSYAASAAYSVDADLRVRTRGWALALAVVFLAHSADNPLMGGIGRRTMDALLEEH